MQVSAATLYCVDLHLQTAAVHSYIGAMATLALTYRHFPSPEEIYYVHPTQPDVYSAQGYGRMG